MCFWTHPSLCRWIHRQVSRFRSSNATERVIFSQKLKLNSLVTFLGNELWPCYGFCLGKIIPISVLASFLSKQEKLKIGTRFKGLFSLPAEMFLASLFCLPQKTRENKSFNQRRETASSIRSTKIKRNGWGVDVLIRKCFNKTCWLMIARWQIDSKQGKGTRLGTETS